MVLPILHGFEYKVPNFFLNAFSVYFVPYLFILCFQIFNDTSVQLSLLVNSLLKLLLIFFHTNHCKEISRQFLVLFVLIHQALLGKSDLFANLLCQIGVLRFQMVMLFVTFFNFFGDELNILRILLCKFFVIF